MSASSLQTAASSTASTAVSPDDMAAATVASAVARVAFSVGSTHVSSLPGTGFCHRDSNVEPNETCKEVGTFVRMIIEPGECGGRSLGCTEEDYHVGSRIRSLNISDPVEGRLPIPAPAFEPGIDNGGIGLSV